MTEPLIRIVRGRPTDEELAAVVAVLLAVCRAAAPGAGQRGRVTWARPEPGDRYRSPISWRTGHGREKFMTDPSAQY